MEQKYSDNINESDMYFTDHIKAFVSSLFPCVVIFLVATIIFYLKSEQLFNLFLSKGKSVGYEFVYISPGEILGQQIRIAGLLGFAITIPVIYIQIVLFVRPAFESSIKAFVTLFIEATLMFFIGSVFSVKIIVPFLLNMFYSLGTTSGIEAQISIQKYTDFYLGLTIAFGVIFEIPIVSYILAKIGLINSKLLSHTTTRLVVCGVALFIGALITPPDIMSQVIVATPIICLFELSILICKVVEKNNLMSNCRMCE